MPLSVYNAVWMIEKSEQGKTYRLHLKIKLNGKNHDIYFHPKIVKGLFNRMMVLEDEGFKPIEEI